MKHDEAVGCPGVGTVETSREKLRSKNPAACRCLYWSIGNPKAKRPSEIDLLMICCYKPDVGNINGCSIIWRHLVEGTVPPCRKRFGHLQHLPKNPWNLTWCHHQRTPKLSRPHLRDQISLQPNALVKRTLPPLFSCQPPFTCLVVVLNALGIVPASWIMLHKSRNLWTPTTVSGVYSQWMGGVDQVHDQPHFGWTPINLTWIECRWLVLGLPRALASCSVDSKVPWIDV